MIHLLSANVCFFKKKMVHCPVTDDEENRFYEFGLTRIAVIGPISRRIVDIIYYFVIFCIAIVFPNVVNLFYSETMGTFSQLALVLFTTAMGYAFTLLWWVYNRPVEVYRLDKKRVYSL